MSSADLFVLSSVAVLACGALTCADQRRLVVPASLLEATWSVGTGPELLHYMQGGVG